MGKIILRLDRMMVERKMSLNVETKCEGRRRSYVLTEKGEERLHGEMDRLTAQMNDYQRLLKGGDKPCELTDGTRSGN